MSINYLQDDENILKKYCVQVMKDYKEFRVLRHLHFLFVWKMGDPEYDKEKMQLEATIRKLPNRERDIYRKDVELRVHWDTWQQKSKKQRYRLIFHELLHVEVELSENRQIVIDDDGRIVFNIIPHDIVIHAFKREVEEFGVPSSYKYTISTLTSVPEKVATA